MQIVGHALTLDLVLVTNNTKEFARVEGLGTVINSVSTSLSL